MDNFFIGFSVGVVLCGIYHVWRLARAGAALKKSHERVKRLEFQNHLLHWIFECQDLAEKLYPEKYDKNVKTKKNAKK